MIELTTDQQKHAVQLFAQGYSRSEVVSHFIDNDTEVIKQLEKSQDEGSFRKVLSDKLTTCDPSSVRFAITKHKDYYNDQKDALTKALSNTYQNLVIKSVKWLQQSIDKIDDRIAEIEHTLSTAMETTPVGASEFISMQNMLNNLEKRKVEMQDKLLERLERIHQRTIAF